jgi:hypothetical protein
MTRHGPLPRTTAPRRRGSTGRYARIAMAPVVRHVKPVGVTARSSPTWPRSRMLDQPPAPHVDVRDRRWHTPKHKSP